MLFLLPFSSTSIKAQYAYKIAYWSDNGGWRLKERYVVEYQLFSSDSLLIELRNQLYNDGKPYSGTRYGYNNKKQKTIETDFYRNDSIDKILQQRNYVYNDNDQLSKMYYGLRDKKGDSVTITDLYTYDITGKLMHLIRSATYEEYRAKTTYTYKYQSGKTIVTELKYFPYKKKPIKTVKVYNEKGLLIKETGKDIKIEFTYKYDNNGEWVVKKICEVLGVWQCHGEHRKTLVDLSE